MLRQIFLDTETTGLEIRDGNRIIEIGCIEMIDRKLTGNNYHQYIKVDRDSEEGALNVHGITTKFLSDKPYFNEIFDDFLSYVNGAELIIHNAPFDVAFLNNEFSLLGKLLSNDKKRLENSCHISDSLVLAREMHPGQRNSLDALCKRYDIINEHRTLHGALLDSEILADVYLAMTGGQKTLMLGDSAENDSGLAGVIEFTRLENKASLQVLKANQDEVNAHLEYIKEIEEGSGKNLWN